MTAIYDEALAPCGINLAQYSLLRTVARRQAVSLTELGRLLELDRSTVGRNARVMVRAGLLSMMAGEDQREQLLTATQSGTDLLAQARPLWEAAQQRIEQRLGDVRLADLQSALSAV